ncbi:HERC6 [Symbiodinium natans]|uniref:HERC6 protein n=1 Tax=Symbiodinium natans TaxID=878477 RepID=A0A812MI96_9DINO|nr:HERC6 [Symbiodinium natans]
MPTLLAPDAPPSLAVEVVPKRKRRRMQQEEPRFHDPGVLLEAPNTGERNSYRMALVHPLRHRDLIGSRLRMGACLDARLELVARSVCLTLGVKMDGQPASRAATKLVLRTLRLARAFGLRYPRGLPRKQDEPVVYINWTSKGTQHEEVLAQCVDAGPRPTRLCSRRSWLIQACVSILSLLSCQEVLCFPGGATQAVLKWRDFIVDSVHAAVEAALLSALHRLPFGAGIIKEELPLYMETLLEFYEELMALGDADEGSDLEVVRCRSWRIKFKLSSP